MSPKRPKMPASVHRWAVARRWFREAWGELRELRHEHAEASGAPVKSGSKPRSGTPATVRANPWPRCTECHRRQLASEFECGEPEHEQVCNSCCGCSSGGRGGGGGGCSCSGRCDCADRDDEREDEDDGDDTDQVPDQAEGTEEGEQR